MTILLSLSSCGYKSSLGRRSNNLSSDFIFLVRHYVAENTRSGSELQGRNPSVVLHFGLVFFLFLKEYLHKFSQLLRITSFFFTYLRFVLRVLRKVSKYSPNGSSFSRSMRVIVRAQTTEKILLSCASCSRPP